MTTSASRNPTRGRPPSLRLKSRSYGGSAEASAKAEAGFTLTEVVVVMLALVVIAGVIAPRFSDFVPSLRTSKAAQELMAILNKARTEAALTGRRFRVSLRQGDSEALRPSYYLAYEPDPLNEPAWFRPMPGDWGRPVSLPEGVAFESLDGAAEDPERSGEFYVEFAADGTATEATIVLANERGRRVTLKVEGTNGRVRLEDEERP
ncbi:MAG: GspH/FimT family pseudopilin [Planctomycetes bacterium]|nr:GspH/FimT family pseudopilin [Planctomycetota bacterium]